jgi:putative oxidoreductase
MNTIEKIGYWGDHHHTKWLDLLRIGLGAILFAKGLYFISDTFALAEMLKNSRFEFLSFMIAHYVAFAHLVGGILIALGLLTRIAILFQLPILIGAIAFVNASRGFFSINFELEISLVVLFLLILFLIYGSGPLSVDFYMRKNPGA